ncbi:hypothetical protein GGI20_001119 [Coemansia sp. BCRC 34301]|nr:hypothetical protein GGI20_001119 [Coemansia sp. BCRC 34301]
MTPLMIATDSMDTAAEKITCHPSQVVRTNPNRIELLNNKEACATWAATAKAMGLIDTGFRHVLKELKYFASLHPLGSNTKLGAADGVWISDTLIDAELTN